MQPKPTQTPVHADLTGVAEIKESENYRNRKCTWLRAVAKLELCGLVLLFLGSSRVARDANAAGLLNKAMRKSLYERYDLPVCRCRD
jgi:hypothetical protein